MTLKEIRKSKHLTLKQVADAIGIHYSALSKIERGNYPLKSNIKKKFLKFYNITEFDEVKTDKEISEELKKENCKLRLENERLKCKIEKIRKALG